LKLCYTHKEFTDYAKYIPFICEGVGAKLIRFGLHIIKLNYHR